MLPPGPLDDAVRLAETTEGRERRGEAIIPALNEGRDQPTLEGLPAEFPFPASSLSAYALGDVYGRGVLDVRTRKLAIVAAFAALGVPDFLRIHAGYALNHGVSEDEIKEIVYPTTIPAGFPRAMQAARALSELLAERRRRDCG